MGLSVKGAIGMSKTVRDIMTTPVVTVRPDTPFKQVAATVRVVGAVPVRSGSCWPRPCGASRGSWMSATRGVRQADQAPLLGQFGLQLLHPAPLIVRHRHDRLLNAHPFARLYGGTAPGQAPKLGSAGSGFSGPVYGAGCVPFLQGPQDGRRVFVRTDGTAACAAGHAARRRPARWQRGLGRR